MHQVMRSAERAPAPAETMRRVSNSWLGEILVALCGPGAGHCISGASQTRIFCMAKQGQRRAESLRVRGRAINALVSEINFKFVRLSMNRRIEHRDWEDTEPEDLPALCVLPISALRHGSASHTPRFMAAMRVQSWRSRLPTNRNWERRHPCRRVAVWVRKLAGKHAGAPSLATDSWPRCAILESLSCP